MNPADFSTLLSNILTAIYTALLIIGLLGSVILWLFSQRFLSKKSFGTILAKKEEEIAALERRIVAVETEHKLLKSPMEGIASGIVAVQAQLTALTKQVAEMDKKLAVHEALRDKAG
jgi:septal ring factor EnvC (AmiA/AmiB activator)